VCKEKVAQLALDMKVVSCLFSFNGSRITFYFTAEGRVDFRELVKVLTNHFRTKIELRQIGPREETKLLGGVGKCGRILCCHAWMNQFHSITLQYATDQLLSTKNIDKISGVCGRLLCCLEHEVDYYREQLETYPALQTEISTDKGKGKVIDINILQKKIKVLLQDKTIIEVDHSAS
jgi:cell fate regulator YaaT (PSP1 superfamily)